MNQLLVIDQIFASSIDVFYNSSLKTNYANYRTNSSTSGHGASVDILENVLIVLPDSGSENNY